MIYANVLQDTSEVLAERAAKRAKKLLKRKGRSKLKKRNERLHESQSITEDRRGRIGEDGKRERKGEWESAQDVSGAGRHTVEGETSDSVEQDEEASGVEKATTGRHYTVSIALPGSIVSNAQTLELKTYLSGQVYDSEEDYICRFVFCSLRPLLQAY